MLIATVFFFFLFGSPLSAQIIITEIMYDLSENSEGSTSDAKREWVEVFNESSVNVDIADWRFNDGKNHKFVAPPENGGKGSLTLPPNSYAIFASDATTFVNEHGSYSATVIDTVMSLNNTTDTLSLIDDTGTTVESVTYVSSTGGSGDGNSLQLVNDTWVAAVPTPGAQNIARSGNESQVNPPAEENQGENSSPPSSSNGSVSINLEERITAIAPEDKTVISGAAVEYKALSYGIKNEPLGNARYIWNFGNGETKEGQSVLHTYSHPGKYVLVLNVSSGKLGAADRSLVTVIEGDIVISRVLKGIIELHNRGNVELNLSWWQLKAGNDTFILPRDTIVLPGNKLIFAEQVTGLSTDGINNVALLYPNGIVARIHGDDTPFIKQETSPSSSVGSGNQSVQTDVIVGNQASSKNTVVAPVPSGGGALSKSEKEDSSEIDGNDLEAAVFESVSENGAGKGGLLVWLLGLFVLIGIAIAGVVIGRTKTAADDIEILD